MSIGKRMESAAIAKYGETGWLARLSNASGVAYPTLSKIKTGRTHNPQPDNFLRIADALGVEYKWLATGTGRRERRSTLSDEEQRWLALRDNTSDGG
jgi:transcriptional regulator with XRE-family HTH domain